MKNYYKFDLNEIVKELQTNTQKGLSPEEVEKRIEKYGLNEINVSKSKSIIQLLIEQLRNPIVILLIGASILSAFTGGIVEAVLIISIIIFMAFIGVLLERKADKSIDQLKSLSNTLTTVIREGKKVEIDSKFLVPGDLVFLTEGDKVPADGRIFELNELQVDESLLTGESLPVIKSIDKLDETLGIGDRVNMLFGGTFVVQGNAKYIVTGTGLSTEIGEIAQELSEQSEKLTPLQVQLNKLSKIMLWGTLIFCGLIMIFSVIRGQTLVEALVQALSLAVAFIPEGLTAVMTVTLAIGVREMVQKKVIIKKLLAAEALGSISILATDKTGTITTGKMELNLIWMFNNEVKANKFRPHGEVEQKIMVIIKYCNNAKGATENAIVDFIERVGFSYELADRLHEHRFSSDFKRMMVILGHEGKRIGYAKGAPDILIPLCSKFIDYKSGDGVELDLQKSNLILEQAENYAEKGYRVLSLAFREFDPNHSTGSRENDEKNLTFVGLICFMDPIRSEVKETVQRLRNAGIRPIMITGDHPAIAKTIALQASIINSEKEIVITGNDLDAFLNTKSDEKLKEIINASVFARVNPKHKQILVDIFRQGKFTIAMAGDGINDAIAISKSDIGIGVVNATDVVKEASDVLITGDYSALASAVEVGRIIIFRTRLYLNYLLSGNLCQVGVFLLALIFNYPVPLTALNLLLINVLTDAAPAMSMAFEKGSPELMKEKPRTLDEGIINKYIWVNIGIQGLISSIFLFAVFAFVFEDTNNLALAQTSVFTAYIFQKLLRAFTGRSFTKSMFEYGIFSNKFILISIGISLAIWAMIVFLGNNIFESERLPLNYLLPIFLLSLIMPLVEEITKFWNRKY
jgi:Ca2+-transporting ATPase